MERVKGEIGDKAYAAGRFPEAIELFRTLSTAETLSPFLTLPGLPADRVSGCAGAASLGAGSATGGQP